MLVVPENVDNGKPGNIMVNRKWVYNDGEQEAVYFPGTGHSS